MERSIHGIGTLFGKAQTKDDAGSRIIAELEEIAAEIKNVESKFNLTTDEDLLESCIYERIALFSRYRYLIKTAKEKGVKGAMISRAGQLEGMNAIWD